MKEELINIIRILGIGCSEIVLDIDLSNFTINSIELIEPDTLVVHRFIDDLDYELFWDDLTYSDRRTIYQVLSIYVYN